MNNQETVAVIMSLYKNDTLSYVRLSVESILKQSYSNIALYIQYDGPVQDEINTYLTLLRDSRVLIYKRAQNRGLAYSLNELLAIVKNKDYIYIARMDADDIADPYRFEKQLSFLQCHENVDVVGGAINEIDEQGNNRKKITKYPCDPADCKAFFAKRNPVAHPTAMFRRSFFQKAGWQYPTDYERNEDTRLWHEGYKHGCVIANLSDVVLDFRITDSMFKHRRNGWDFAKSQLKLRIMISKDLGYGFMSIVYAYAMFLLMISPSWVIKQAYKYLR